MEKPAARSPLQFCPASLLHTLAALDMALHRFVPEKCRHDPDLVRRALLIAHFGVQGTLFGAAYAIFYCLIDHFRGAEVIIFCSAIFALVPWIMLRTGQIGLSGHLIVGTMAGGFTQLTLIEGGIHSHAMAWLASVPLCALLVLGARPAAIWSGVCLFAGAVISAFTLNGQDLEPLYDQRWRNLVDAAGNLGLIGFLFILGLVFEVNRSKAFNRMRASLDELAASNDELAHLNNEKTEFLGMAAHDLRNPLTSIIGFADLLQMEGRGESASHGEEISRSGRRMLELINDLLDANAIEEGRYASQVEPHDLRALVHAALPHHANNSERKSIVLHFPDGPPCWALADRKATTQVVDNLVSNALKYSPPGKDVTLIVRKTGDFAEFLVSDQGPGISEDDQKRLFQKHTKLSARPTGGESSVGLGLSIVKRLAEAMGGGIACESTLGQGSLFIFRLQAMPPELAPRSDGHAPAH